MSTDDLAEPYRERIEADAKRLIEIDDILATEDGCPHHEAGCTDCRVKAWRPILRSLVSDVLRDREAAGPYEAKALDAAADRLEAITDLTGVKLVAIVRNGAEWCRRFERGLAALREENGRLRKALLVVDAHYSASLDWQPPYVRVVRAALSPASPDGREHHHHRCRDEHGCEHGWCCTEEHPEAAPYGPRALTCSVHSPQATAPAVLHPGQPCCCPEHGCFANAPMGCPCSGAAPEKEESRG